MPLSQTWKLYNTEIILSGLVDREHLCQIRPEQQILWWRPRITQLYVLASVCCIDTWRVGRTHTRTRKPGGGNRTKNNTSTLSPGRRANINTARRHNMTPTDNLSPPPPSPRSHLLHLPNLPFQGYIWSKSGLREEKVYLKVRDNMYANVLWCGGRSPSCRVAGGGFINQ